MNDKSAYFSQYAGIIKKADSFDPLPQHDDVIGYQYDINKNVWKEDVEMRKTGDLVSLAPASPVLSWQSTGTRIPILLRVSELPCPG